MAPCSARIATAACELGSGVRIYDLATFVRAPESLITRSGLSSLISCACARLLHVADTSSYPSPSQECAAALETIEDEVFSLAWADRNCCYIAYGDGKARRRASPSSSMQRLPEPSRSPNTNEAQSLNGKLPSDPQVRLWDTRCGRTEYPGYDGSPRGPSRCIQLQEDILACGGGRGECAPLQTSSRTGDRPCLRCFRVALPSRESRCVLPMRRHHRCSLARVKRQRVSSEGCSRQELTSFFLHDSLPAAGCACLTCGKWTAAPR